jgi:hypothetical protein
MAIGVHGDAKNGNVARGVHFATTWDYAWRLSMVDDTIAFFKQSQRYLYSRIKDHNH